MNRCGICGQFMGEGNEHLREDHTEEELREELLSHVDTTGESE